MKIKDKVWNWGHLEGSHNSIVLKDCKMTPEEFAVEYGINKAFIVSYGGNIQPPFDKFADRFDSIGEIKWSVLGDSSTPLPQDRLGFTDEIIKTAKSHHNITGGVVDDFFSPERLERFTPEIIGEIREKLNKNGLDLWCVLYDNQLNLDLKKYINNFDGVSFWLWGAEQIEKLEEYLDKIFKIVHDKKIMLGIYLWDYKDVGTQPMDLKLFRRQMDRYFGLLKNNKIEGIIFCSGVLGDADLETNAVLKEYMAEYGDEEI